MPDLAERLARVALAVGALLAPGAARADQGAAAGPAPHGGGERDAPEHGERAGTPRFRLELGGYADLGAAFHDFGADRSREGGALHDRRLELDTTRLVLELEGELPGEVEFEAEV